MSALLTAPDGHPRARVTGNVPPNNSLQLTGAGPRHLDSHRYPCFVGTSFSRRPQMNEQPFGA